MAATAQSYVPHLSSEKSTATGAAAAETCNAQCGVITTEALTTAAAAASTRTLTNSFIATGSIVLVGILGGTNTRLALVPVVSAVAAGSCTVVITNAHASALNGTVVYWFLVL